MYEQFYGLTDKPFSLTPNPRFVYYSKQYREAENQLLYGISNREGFMLLTGQPGTGKTTLCRDLLEKLDRDKSQSALIFNPFLSGVEMLAALLTEFGIIVPPGANRKDLLDRLNQFLLAQLALGRSCVAIFDEAQHLSPEFLEQIRVLSNLETDQEKLIQIVLAGQPELLDKIRTPMMAQLDQRVSIRCALADLDEEETDRYIHHRLNVAGARGQIRFAPKAVAEIYHASHGVPRLINLVADRALLAGYAAQTRDIQPEHVRKAVAALRGEDAEVDANVAAGSPRSMRPSAPPNDRKAARRAIWFAAAAGVVAVAAIASAAVAFWPREQRRPADEELYWRATMSASTVDAERDLTSLITSYPASRRVDDALLRLAEIELGRADRPDAVAHLTDLARRGRSSFTRTRATLLATVARLDGGDTTNACGNRPTAVDSADAVNPLIARDLQNINALCSARDSVVAAAATIADTTAAARAATPARRSRRRPGSCSRSRRRERHQRSGIGRTSARTGRRAAATHHAAVSLISDALNEAQREANKRRKESQPALLGENPISPPAVVVAPPYHPRRRMVYSAIGIVVVASALATGIVAYRRAKSQTEVGAQSDSAATPVSTTMPAAAAIARNTPGLTDTTVRNAGAVPGVAVRRLTQRTTTPPAPKPIHVATNATRPPVVTPQRREAPTSVTAPTPTSSRSPSLASAQSMPLTGANPEPVAPPQPRVSQQDVRVIVDPTVLRPGDSLFIRAYTEHTRGNLDAAADLYERALTKPPVSPELYNDYGALLATRGKHAAAITMYNLGIAANDKDGRLWANLGDSYRAIGRRADAMSAYFEAVKLDPMNIGVRLRLAAEYASLGDTASARRGFDEAVRAAPTDAEAHYRYGAFLQTQHDVAGAIRELQTFVELAPGQYPSDVIERTKAYIASLRRVPR